MKTARIARSSPSLASTWWVRRGEEIRSECAPVARRFRTPFQRHDMITAGRRVVGRRLVVRRRTTNAVRDGSVGLKDGSPQREYKCYVPSSETIQRRAWRRNSMFADRETDKYVIFSRAFKHWLGSRIV